MRSIYTFLTIVLLPKLAFAQEAAAEGPGVSSLIIQLLIIFAIFYFLIIRPQQKKLKNHQSMTAALGKGDKVITQGGIGGVVTEAKEGENFIEVEIASGVKVNVLRSTVSEKLGSDVKFKISGSSNTAEKPKKKAKAKTKAKAKAKKKG